MVRWVARVVACAAVVSFGVMSPVPAQASEPAAAAPVVAAFTGTATVNCQLGGCTVSGSSATCVVAGTVPGACGASFSLWTSGPACFAVTHGAGVGTFSAPGVGATVDLTAVEAANAVVAEGAAVDTGSGRLLFEMRIVLPATLCSTEGSLPFTGSAAATG